ncbi:MAG TPA: WD40 repeat domain-containing protein [Candidatus Methylacidiphilales bacterium]|nr:WD40 repeat domain-containing protein [Candidatus Methylacidiphilales bacterium]
MSSSKPAFTNKVLQYLVKPVVALPLLLLVIALIVYAIPGRQASPAEETIKSDAFPIQFGFSPNGKSVILVGNGYAELLDANEGRSLGVLSETDVLFTWFSPDGSRIVVTTLNGSYLWDLKSVPYARLGRLGKTQTPMLRNSPDGTRLLVIEGAPYTASMYSVVSCQSVWSHIDPSKPAAPAPARPEEEVQLLELAFSSDGHEITLVENRLVGTTDGDPVSQLRLLRWNALTGKELSPPSSLPYSQTFQLMNSSGTRILTSQGQALFLWDTTTGQPVGEPIVCQKTDQTMVFSPDDTRLLVETAVGIVQMRSTQNGQLLGELKLEGVKPEDVFFANFSPDGKRVLTCTSSGAARTWDVATCAPLCPQIAVQRLSPQNFTTDSLRLVGKDKNIVQFWDAATLKTIGEPLDVKSLVEDITFNKDGSRMLTNSSPNASMPRLWNMATRTEIPLKPVSGSGTLEPLFKKPAN